MGDSGPGRRGKDVFDTRITPWQTRQSRFADVGRALIVGSVADHTADVTKTLLADCGSRHVTLAERPKEIRQSSAPASIFEPIAEQNALRG